MARVLAVNNCPTTERFERLRKCLTENGAEVTSADWVETAASKFNEFDGVALSDAPDMMSEESTQRKFRAEVDAISDAQVPVLAVCSNHQLMAHAFGSGVVKDKENVTRRARATMLVRDPLLSGLPREMVLLESHDEIVQRLPAGFQLLAMSETSPIAAMKHETRPLYGVQFHPERYSPDNSAGNRVIGNFIKLLR
ncbi:MAG: gamma-glutamyl-gamma-aminobutyrate hydrolase family protein [Nitrososphaerales archaeon]